MKYALLLLIASCGPSGESTAPVEPESETSATTGYASPAPVDGPSECAAPVPAVCEAEQPWDPRPVERMVPAVRVQR